MIKTNYASAVLREKHIKMTLAKEAMDNLIRPEEDVAATQR